MHRHFIDDLELPSQQGKGTLKRVPDVFDCWFESGSMPYAQAHYPFENKERFEASFPADFVAEGLDQTRGWFYTLMVLSTALFDKPAFKNLVCNGLVLAADGKKMSKRLKNYPDPTEVRSCLQSKAERAAGKASWKEDEQAAHAWNKAERPAALRRKDQRKGRPERGAQHHTRPA